MSRLIPIAGTWGWRDRWWQQDAALMARLGAQIVTVAGRPYRWSTDLIGWKFWRKERLSDWEAGADALAYFCDAVPYADRNIIAHSHGGQVALFAAASGLDIRRLLTVSTPVRDDVPIATARPRIAQWWHICSADDDRFQRWGMFGDGRISTTRVFADRGAAADINIRVPGLGHTRLLTDPACFDLWESMGLRDFLLAPDKDAAPCQT